MDPTIGIAIGSVVVGLLLLAAFLLLMALVLLVILRISGRRRKRARGYRAPPSTVPPASEPATGVDTAATVTDPPPPATPTAPTAPALGHTGGLLGFFDDEVPSAPMPQDDGAKTELFQRGAIPFDWDDDDEEDREGATEIFSSHGAAGDEAEFAYDPEDDSSIGN